MLLFVFPLEDIFENVLYLSLRIEENIQHLLLFSCKVHSPFCLTSSYHPVIIYLTFPVLLVFTLLWIWERKWDRCCALVFFWVICWGYDIQTTDFYLLSFSCAVKYLLIHETWIISYTFLFLESLGHRIHFECSVCPCYLYSAFLSLFH